jgi:hypothetical protein
MDHFDLILSSISPQMWEENARAAEPLLAHFKTSLVELYRTTQLVDPESESAMIQRILSGDDENASLILLFHEGKLKGTLKASYSTNATGLPKDLMDLNQPELMNWLTPLPVKFEKQLVPLLQPSKKSRKKVSRIVWDPRSSWWSGGTAYLSTFRVQPDSEEEPILWMLYTIAISTKLWERGGQTLPSSARWPGGFESFSSVVSTYLSTWQKLAVAHGGAREPLHFHWPKGIPKRLKRSDIGVLNSRFTLTCDGEDPVYVRYYQLFGFREIYRFSDPDRNGKQTVVMWADKDAFINAFERIAKARVEKGMSDAFSLQFLPNGFSDLDTKIACAGKIISTRTLGSLSDKVVLTRIKRTERKVSPRKKR